MRSFKFYYDLMSPPSRSLLIFFELSKMAHEKCQIAIRKGEHLTEHYAKNINPRKKLPVIDDNGFKLSESVAIIHYLKREKFFPETPLFPSDSEKLTRIDEYLEWMHNYLRAGSGMVFILKWALPFVTEKASDPQIIRRYEKLFENSCNILEEHWIQDNDFINGNQLTFADIVAACDIEQTRCAGYNPTENRPKLKTWLGRVKAQTNPHFDEAHSLIYKYAEKYKGIPPVLSKKKA